MNDDLILHLGFFVHAECLLRLGHCSKAYASLLLCGHETFWRSLFEAHFGPMQLSLAEDMLRRRKQSWRYLCLHMDRSTNLALAGEKLDVSGEWREWQDKSIFHFRLVVQRSDSPSIRIEQAMSQGTFRWRVPGIFEPSEQTIGESVPVSGHLYWTLIDPGTDIDYQCEGGATQTEILEGRYFSYPSSHVSSRVLRLAGVNRDDSSIAPINVVDVDDYKLDISQNGVVTGVTKGDVPFSSRVGDWSNPLSANPSLLIV